MENKIKRLIVYFTGRTTEAESIFTYGAGESHQSLQNPSFLPNFISVEDLLKHPNANMCEGSKSCLYDLSSTNDISIAMQSKVASEQKDEANAALGTGMF